MWTGVGRMEDWGQQGRGQRISRAEDGGSEGYSTGRSGMHGIGRSGGYSTEGQEGTVGLGGLVQGNQEGMVQGGPKGIVLGVR